VQKWSNKLDYGCRYTVWRLIYQDDYNKFIQSEQGAAPGPPPVTAPAQHLNQTSPSSDASPAVPAQSPGGVAPAPVAPVT
jgi:hypothetical protein